jgi:integrase
MPNRIRFNQRAVADLPVPRKGRANYYDTQVRKLALRITQAGGRAFYVVKRNGAAMEWVRLGTVGDMTVEQARKAAERVLGDYARGVSPASKKRAEKHKQTLAEAFADYKLLHVTPRGVKSAGEIEAMWQRFLGTMPDAPKKKHGRKRAKHPAGVDWSKRKLDAIESTEVRALHAAVGKTHRTMANRVVELLSAIYGHARKCGYAGANPAAGVEPFREKSRDRFIQPDELPRFFAALAEDTSEDFQSFVLVSLLTGVRRTNVLSMRWADVNLESATLRIPETKNNEPLNVALVPEAVEILRKRKPEGEAVFVFPAPSRTGYMTPPKKRWRELLKRAEVSDLRIHDLRRSLGSWQAISGASLTIIGKSLGHRSPDATAIYARLHMDPVRASVNAATSAMLEAAGVKTRAEVVALPEKKGRAK